MLQGVEYIIHVASPLPGGDQDLMTPAVKGTVEVLESALKVASITKVVITASIASLVPLDSYTDGFVVTGKSPSTLQTILIHTHEKPALILEQNPFPPKPSNSTTLSFPLWNQAANTAPAKLLPISPL